MRSVSSVKAPTDLAETDETGRELPARLTLNDFKTKLGRVGPLFDLHPARRQLPSRHTNGRVCPSGRHRPLPLLLMR